VKRHLGRRSLRIVAMLQVYNERRVIASCLEHMREQGIDVYLVDHESTDETLAIAQSYLGNGVIGIETLPREEDVLAMRVLCARTEQLAQTLDADWLMRVDADELHVSSQRGRTLAETIAALDEAGYNAAPSVEFTFLPTREFPDHDHPHFTKTMRWYYPFLPQSPYWIRMWKRQAEPVDLATSGGHMARFPGRKLAPITLNMRHYLFISKEHAIEKYVRRRFAADELADGWHGWRSRMTEELIWLPSSRDLRNYIADHLLDPSAPRKRHVLDQVVAAARRRA
jgi:hypothetical protein